MKSVCLFAFGMLSCALWCPSPGHAETAGNSRPVLINTCLVTAKFTELVDFYQKVLGIAPRLSNGDYAEFRTDAGVLAIFSTDAQERYIPGSTRPGSNRSAILEFKVKGVDAEFLRLHSLVKDWVKPPSNQPWGTRSFYFRDPDGNLIDFYAPRTTR